MRRNFYLVLGVSPTASSAEIQEAYRRLARAYHPDVSGADTADSFREIQEAYETLRDDGLRGAYDAQLQRAQPRMQPPLNAGVVQEEGEALHLDLWMSAFEAAQGGALPVDLPVLQRCVHCGGRGYRSWSACQACWGRGREVRSERFTLHVPPGLTGGAVVTVPLQESGLLYRRLVIHVRIEH